MYTFKLKRKITLIGVVIGFTIVAPFLVLVIMAQDVTLQWDQNTEPDLDGYELYYDKASPSPPYEGTGGSVNGVVTGSPVLLPLSIFHQPLIDVCEITITGLEDCVGWYFAVTAYDTQQLKSGYSNIVNTPIYLRNFREKGD